MQRSTLLFCLFSHLLLNVSHQRHKVLFFSVVILIILKTWVVCFCCHECNLSVMLLINVFHFNCLCVQISAVRLPREPSNPERLKGFGYAEFDDVESLLRALSLSEEVREPEDTIKQSETFTKVQERSVNNSCNKLLLCSCQQNLGNRRIRVDIADQSNDKGTLLFLDILKCSSLPLQSRAAPLSSLKCSVI